MKYKVCVPVDYIQGHLRYGHLEYTIDANSGEEAIELAKKSVDYEVVVDDYEVEDCGSEDWPEAEAWEDEEIS